MILARKKRHLYTLIKSVIPVLNILKSFFNLSWESSLTFLNNK
jgi:hypothetical protein